MSSREYLPPFASQPHTSSDDAASDCDSDHSALMSLDSFFESNGTSRTSVDFSMRSASPAPSVFSMTSSMRAQAYKKEYGRDLNNYSDVYRLPADEEELERLDRQYEMFSKVMGKYSPPLPEVLQDDGFEVKTVLDLGCGSGSWIMDVARDFPHCSAVAVDLVPMQSTDMPPNCRSEVDDINLGLEHFYGDFNVVHVGFIATGIRNYHSVINQISHVLRPGGLIDITETPFSLFGPDKNPISFPPGTFAPPWVALWVSFAVKAINARGGDIESAMHVPEYISSHPAFENVEIRDIWVPIAPFVEGDDPETMFWNDIAATMRDDIKAFMNSGRPLLLGYGLSEEFVDDMQQKACQELDEAKIPLYAHITNVCARKRH